MCVSSVVPLFVYKVICVLCMCAIFPFDLLNAGNEDFSLLSDDMFMVVMHPSLSPFLPLSDHVMLFTL